MASEGQNKKATGVGTMHCIARANRLRSASAIHGPGTHSGAAAISF